MKKGKENQNQRSYGVELIKDGEIKKVERKIRAGTQDPHPNRLSGFLHTKKSTQN